MGQLEVEGSNDPLLGFDWFARVVHRFQRNIYLLDHQFTIKGYSSGTVSWKRCLGQGMGKGHGASTLSPVDHSPYIFTRSPTWKLSKPHSFRFFMEASLHKHIWLNHWPLAVDSTSSPSSLLGSQEGGTEIPNPLTNMVGSPDNQPPSLGAVPVYLH